MKKMKKMTNPNITQMKNEKITQTTDLKGHSLDEMMTESYGKKGTKKRAKADKDVSKKVKTLASDNRKKELKEGKKGKKKNKVKQVKGKKGKRTPLVVKVTTKGHGKTYYHGKEKRDNKNKVNADVHNLNDVTTKTKVTKLKIWMMENGINQKELASRTSLSTNTINRLVNNGHATKSVIKLVAYDLGMPSEQLTELLKEHTPTTLINS